MDWDDDWVGEPPEGHHARERAKPDFWRDDWRAVAAYAGIGLAIIILLIVLLL